MDSMDDVTRGAKEKERQRGEHMDRSLSKGLRHVLDSGDKELLEIFMRVAIDDEDGLGLSSEAHQGVTDSFCAPKVPDVSSQDTVLKPYLIAGMTNIGSDETHGSMRSTCLKMLQKIGITEADAIEIASGCVMEGDTQYEHYAPPSFLEAEAGRYTHNSHAIDFILCNNKHQAALVRCVDEVIGHDLPFFDQDPRSEHHDYDFNSDYDAGISLSSRFGNPIMRLIEGMPNERVRTSLRKRINYDLRQAIDFGAEEEKRRKQEENRARRARTGRAVRKMQKEGSSLL